MAGECVIEFGYVVFGWLSLPAKPRATGKDQQLFEEVSALPRRQQDKVVEFVSAFVRQQRQAEK